MGIKVSLDTYLAQKVPLSLRSGYPWTYPGYLGGWYTLQHLPP